MIKNRYTNPIRHAAFDEAVKLAKPGRTQINI
jgi:hypothetical protein